MIRASEYGEVAFVKGLLDVGGARTGREEGVWTVTWLKMEPSWRQKHLSGGIFVQIMVPFQSKRRSVSTALSASLLSPYCLSQVLCHRQKLLSFNLNLHLTALISVSIPQLHSRAG
ncbi:hypothetical protein AAHA92_33150 [Salvia divinorum]|uniref:Uncharacterized protein n=1 Tax=Salvia divinorum TaxID=28513 RepID=A0ABD1FN10_SALDI